MRMLSQIVTDTAPTQSQGESTVDYAYRLGSYGDTQQQDSNANRLRCAMVLAHEWGTMDKKGRKAWAVAVNLKMNWKGDGNIRLYRSIGDILLDEAKLRSPIAVSVLGLSWRDMSSALKRFRDTGSLEKPAPKPKETKEAKVTKQLLGGSAATPAADISSPASIKAALAKPEVQESLCKDPEYLAHCKQVLESAGYDVLLPLPLEPNTESLAPEQPQAVPVAAVTSFPSDDNDYGCDDDTDELDHWGPILSLAYAAEPLLPDGFTLFDDGVVKFAEPNARTHTRSVDLGVCDAAGCFDLHHMQGPRIYQTRTLPLTIKPEDLVKEAVQWIAA